MTKTLLALALAAALATPALSQTRQSSDPGQAFAQQTSKSKKSAKKSAKKPAQRYVARQHTAEKPCALRTWVGCHGWDPDPNVRSMIRMDSNLYDD